MRSGRPRGPGRALKKMGGFAPHIFEGLPRPPRAGHTSKNAPPKNRPDCLLVPPKIRPDCLQVPRGIRRARAGRIRLWNPRSASDRPSLRLDIAPPGPAFWRVS